VPGRFITWLGVFMLALATTAASRQSPAQTAKPWTAPRTSWGDPDFSGLWNYATMTPLERPQAFAGKAVLTEAEAAAYEQQTTDRQAVTNNTAGPDWWDDGTRHLTERRTSLVVDPANGRVPPLTPEAQKRAAARTAANRARGPADGPEDLGLNVRCIVWSTAGPPMLPGVYNNNVEFIQTRDHIVIVNEMIHDARIVPMDGRPHGAVRSWMGDSRGRWDGQTLVVDTINFNEKAAFRGSGEGLHLIERFTRVSDGTIRYEFTAEDPATWTRPWTAMVPMTKIDGTMLEYACHEGNERSMVGTLLGARTQDPRER
jgi:hypothetical protein